MQFLVNNYSRAGDGIGSMFPKVIECTVSERDVIFCLLQKSQLYYLTWFNIASGDSPMSMIAESFFPKSLTE